MTKLQSSSLIEKVSAIYSITTTDNQQSTCMPITGMFSLRIIRKSLNHTFYYYLLEYAI